MTIKLQLFETNIDTYAGFYTLSPSMNKKWEAVWVTNCANIRTWFSVRNVRRSLLPLPQTSSVVWCHQITGIVCFDAAILLLHLQNECHLERSGNCILIQKSLPYLFCSENGLTACVSPLLKFFTEQEHIIQACPCAPTESGPVRLSWIQAGLMTIQIPVHYYNKCYKVMVLNSSVSSTGQKNKRFTHMNT